MSGIPPTLDVPARKGREPSWRFQMPLAALTRALEDLAAVATADVKALVEALTARTHVGRPVGSKTVHHVDWSPLLRVDVVDVEVPKGRPPYQVANSAHTWAARHGLKIATRRNKDDTLVRVFVLARD